MSDQIGPTERLYVLGNLGLVYADLGRYGEAISEYPQPVDWAAFTLIGQP